MLKLVKEQKVGALLVRLIGTIDERVDFDQLIGPFTGELHINCHEVPRINSHGIRQWVTYFEKLTQSGTKVKFLECSPAIVQQFELVVNFTAGGAVESICLPYLCSLCKSQLINVMKISDVRRLNLQIPDFKCPKCANGIASFDDIPAEYFSFLNRIR